MTNTLLSPDQFLGIKAPKPREQRLSDKMFQQNKDAREYNKQREKDYESIRNSNSTHFLFCPLCESKLIRKKNIKKEVSGVIIEVPSYSCPLDKNRYEGYLPHVHHSTKPEIEAILVEYNSQQ